MPWDRGAAAPTAQPAPRSASVSASKPAAPAPQPAPAPTPQPQSNNAAQVAAAGAAETPAVEDVGELQRKWAEVVERVCPGARPVPFGHFGDGNLHYNVSQPIGMEKARYLALWQPMSDAVHALVADMAGSISAEHGIGQMKRDALVRFKSPVEIIMMRAIKAALDPKGILNPGKVL